MSDPSGTARPAGRGALAVSAALAVAVQVVVLYAPRAPGSPLFPGSDKVVHVLVFAVPVLLLLLAGAPVRLVLVVLGLHAVVSEVVQGAVLPGRSADPLDVVADLVGVAVGWWLWRLARVRGTPARW